MSQLVICMTRGTMLVMINWKLAPSELRGLSKPEELRLRSLREYSPWLWSTKWWMVKITQRRTQKFVLTSVYRARNDYEKINKDWFWLFVFCEVMALWYERLLKWIQYEKKKKPTRKALSDQWESIIFENKYGQKQNCRLTGCYWRP